MPLPRDLEPELRAEIVKLLDLAGKKSLSHIKRLLSLLEKHGICVRIRLHSRLVGCHEKNRDGYGVNPGDVETLISDIFELGWDSDEVRAVCIEISPEGETFNLKMIKDSKGALAETAPGMLRYSSLWGSHTNQGIRCINAECKHPDESMTVAGKLNIAKIEAKDVLCDYY